MTMPVILAVCLRVEGEEGYGNLESTLHPA